MIKKCLFSPEKGCDSRLSSDLIFKKVLRKNEYCYNILSDIILQGPGPTKVSEKYSIAWPIRSTMSITNFPISLFIILLF